MKVKYFRLVTVFSGAVLAAAIGSAEAGPEVEQPPVEQPAGDVAGRFERAAERKAAGAHREAAAAFVKLADDARGSPYADDALFEAAKLYEEKLTEPQTALRLYRRLLAEYPDSRTALAASRRATAIAENIGPDGDATALARFTDLLQRFPERGESDSIAVAEQLLSEYPDWHGRARLQLWLAGVHQRGGRHRRALDYYLAAAAVAKATQNRDDELFSAYRGAGDAAAALGRFDTAERYYRLMPVGGDPARQRSFEDALADLDRARMRTMLYRVSLALIAVVVLVLLVSLRLAAGSIAASWRALRRPSVETVFMAPIAALLIAASLTAHYAIAPAVTIISLGGIAITWLSGAGLAAGRRSRRGLGPWRRLLHALLTALAVVAICYVAVHRNRLIDMIIETVRFGPDL